jgi:chorismate mutase-like protein
MDAPSLDDLRAQIDGIDEALHDLLMRRAELVGRIAAAKGGNGGLALRPGREAQVLRRLLARHEGQFPRPALVRLWREIMGAFTFLQGPVRVAVCRPADQAGFWDLARDHFGAQIPFQAHETAAQVIAAMRLDPNVIGVVPAPVQDEPAPWWIRLTSGEATTPNIVQRLPFVAMPNSRGRDLDSYVLARIDAEASGEDHALLAIESPVEISRSRLIGAVIKAGFHSPTSVIDVEHSGTWWDLVEVPTFVADQDPRLPALRTALGVEHARVVALGAWAVPPKI